MTVTVSAPTLGSETEAPVTTRGAQYAPEEERMNRDVVTGEERGRDCGVEGTHQREDEWSSKLMGPGKVLGSKHGGRQTSTEENHRVSSK